MVDRPDTSPAVRLNGTDPSTWRLELLDRLLLWVLGLGTGTFLLSVPSFVINGLIAVVVLDVVLLSVLAVLAFGRSLPHGFRAVALLVVAGTLGMGLSIGVGWSGALLLLSVPLLGTVLLGTRAMVPAWAVVTVGYAVGVASSDHLDGAFTSDGAADLAAGVILFAFVAAVLTFASGWLIDRLERALRAEHRAAAEAARLAAAVEQASDSILLFGPDGVVVYENPAHRRLAARLGPLAQPATVDELVDKVVVWSDRPDSDPALPSSWSAWSGVVVLADREGADHRFEVRSAPLRDDDGVVSGTAMTLQDVSERHRMEEQLRRSERLESLGTLAAGVAHDFNNVLAGVRLLAEMLVRQSDDPAIVDPASTIVGACDRVGVTVNQMLLFGRHGTPERCPIVLADAVAEALTLVRAALPPGCELSVETADRSTVIASHGEIQQIVMNLATNAVHAMSAVRRRGGSVARHVLAIEIHRVTSSVGADEVELVVTDTGSGIDPADLPHLFDPFFTTKPPGEGAGMGLASVHGIVAGLGGSISVTSEPGIGSEFRVRLPAGSEATADTVGHDPDAGVAPVAPLQILFVDDEDPIRSAAAAFLGRSGHTVTTACDGLEGLARFEDDPWVFDVVVTDISMPRLDGPAMVARLRAHRPDLPVLFSTGYGDVADVPGAEILAKPYSFAELLGGIERATSRVPQR